MPGTRLISARELRHMYTRKGGSWVRKHLTESLEKKHLHPTDFSIRDLAMSVVKDGDEWVRSMVPGKSGTYHLLEAGSVQYSDFSAITGQIFFNMIKEAYDDEEFVFTKMVKTYPSNIPDIEKIPGISRIGDKFTDTTVNEGDTFPQMAVGEDFIHIGAKKKRGGIVAVTREAVAFDKTGLLLQRCKELGHYLGVSIEKRLIDTLIDGNAAAASIHNGGTRYHWKGTSYAAYQATSPWINVKTSNALASWTNVEAAEVVLSQITDPYTGEPIMIEPTHIIVPPELKHTAYRIMNATNVQTHAGGYATSGNLQDYHAPSPLDPYKVVCSRLFRARMNAAGQTASSTWYIGNPAKAIGYWQNFPLTTRELGAGSTADFERDIVAQYRADERGTPGWLEPRLVLKNSA